MIWKLYTESEISSDRGSDTLTKFPISSYGKILCCAPSPWVKPFFPQQGFSINQVLVTRKSLKNPKEPEPTAPLYPILQKGTEEELLFPPPYQPPQTTACPHHPSTQGRNKGRGARTKYTPSVSHGPGGAGRLHRCPPLTSGRPPPMRKETKLINIGPSLLVTYITGDPQMPSSQITLEI